LDGRGISINFGISRCSRSSENKDLGIPVQISIFHMIVLRFHPTFGVSSRIRVAISEFEVANKNINGYKLWFNFNFIL
jgi:hypothetical protein